MTDFLAEWAKPRPAHLEPKFVWSVEAALSHAHPAFVGIADAYLQAEIRRQARAHDDAIRELLGAWVSELEPTVHVSYGGAVLGLGWADDDTGRTIVVARNR